MIIDIPFAEHFAEVGVDAILLNAKKKYDKEKLKNDLIEYAYSQKEYNETALIADEC